MQEASLINLSIFICLFIFSFSSWSTALGKSISKPHHKNSRNIASILESNELIPNKIDQNSAYMIYELIETNDPNQIKSKINDLKSAVLGNPRFEIFHEWTHTLLNITTQNQSEKIAEVCSEINNTGDLTLEQIQQTYAQNICLKYYFGALENEILNSGKLTDFNNQFLKKMNKIIIQKDIRSNLVRLLNRTETKGVAHTELSRTIAQAFISNNEVPSQDVLKNILITYDLTSFIQRQGFNRPQTARVLGEEFDELGRKIIAASDKNEESQLPRLVDNFIRFYNYNSTFLQTKTAKNRIVFVGKELSGNADYEFSQKVLAIALKDQDSEISHEALFVTLWSYLMEGKNDKAIDFINDNQLLELYPNLSLKLKYWVAHTAEVNKKKGLSVKLYNQLIEQSPLSFYSIMAIKNLGKLEESDSISDSVYNLEKINNSQITLNDFSPEMQSTLVRLKLWDQFNLRDFARGEIHFISNAPAEKLKSKNSKLSEEFIKENAYIVMAGAFASNNNFISGFNLIQQGLSEKKISHNTYLLSTLFPNHYFESIKKLDNEVDPVILMSLIRQESGFNPRARSLVGARGLMQLMPTTAKMMNRRVSANDLEKPETNLKLGIQHFKYLMKKYDNNLVYVLAAYNAGEHRVTRWQKEIFSKNENMLETIEKIPYQETRDYVKLIFRNMYFYKMLASNKIDTEAHTRIYDINLGFTH
jgi:soluble lytic murein transglycosylase